MKERDTQLCSDHDFVSFVESVVLTEKVTSKRVQTTTAPRMGMKRISDLSHRKEEEVEETGRKYGQDIMMLMTKIKRGDLKS